MGDRPRVRVVRGAARRPRCRGRVHLVAEHAALRLVDPRRGGGEARALREADEQARRRGRVGIRRCRAARAHPDGGVHVPAQPADRTAPAARGRRCDRRPAARALLFQLFAVRRGQHPFADGRGGRQPDGRRLLLHQRLPFARRRARGRLRAAVRRSQRHRLGLQRRDALSGRRLRPVRLRDGPTRP